MGFEEAMFGFGFNDAERTLRLNSPIETPEEIWEWWPIKGTKDSRIGFQCYCDGYLLAILSKGDENE